VRRRLSLCKRRPAASDYYSGSNADLANNHPSAAPGVVAGRSSLPAATTHADSRPRMTSAFIRNR
jgi:hypothetical protein